VVTVMMRPKALPAELFEQLGHMRHGGDRKKSPPYVEHIGFILRWSGQCTERAEIVHVRTSSLRAVEEGDGR
jgi:hypothetical protein